MDDLENHRKRAKGLVRQHRARAYVVADRLRRSLPRFAGLTDRQVLDADFALHDAQQVIAMELGFDSWAALKEAPPMTTTSTDTTAATPTAVFEARANVFVTDFGRAIAFYRDVLGFDVVFEYGEPPFYGQVSLEGASVYLRHVDETPFKPDVREEEQLVAVSFLVPDAKERFLAYQDGGADFQERLQRKAWDADEFVVRDPDGNLILFGSPASPR